VKIFNQSHRVTCRDNLVVEQPHSNGIWYDVGNRDGVFVNNWIEDAIDGFFFEISRGAIAAGNVFVRCEKGIRILNAAGARIYNNTFVNTPASFERNERSAVGDHFGWHPATGPGVDERDGHVFVGNLLVADAGYRQPLLRFEQPAALCGRLTRPQAAQLDGNLYVRLGAAAPAPLVVWSPAAGEKCQVELDSLDAVRGAQPGFEARGRYVPEWFGALFKSPELREYAMTRPVTEPYEPLPLEVRRLLGWTEQESRWPGAYPPRR
jgi:hypothetical protein